MVAMETNAKKQEKKNTTHVHSARMASSKCQEDAAAQFHLKQQH